MKDLVLYYNAACPYCAKVLNFMKKNDITLTLKNTSDFNTRQELVTIGGKGQVPCLLIDGKAMYESDDIINYLEESYKK